MMALAISVVATGLLGAVSIGLWDGYHLSRCYRYCTRAMQDPALHAGHLVLADYHRCRVLLRRHREEADAIASNAGALAAALAEIFANTGSDTPVPTNRLHRAEKGKAR